jgi:hypothetical protein
MTHPMPAHAVAAQSTRAWLASAANVGNDCGSIRWRQSAASSIGSGVHEQRNPGAASLQFGDDRAQCRGIAAQVEAMVGCQLAIAIGHQGDRSGRAAATNASKSDTARGRQRGFSILNPTRARVSRAVDTSFGRMRRRSGRDAR